MTHIKNVSLIGSGNVAWHLAPALDNAGYPVREVYSRSLKNADALIKKLYQAEVKADLDFSNSSSTIFIIASSDDAIETISHEIILPDDAILIHTSGVQPMSILSYSASENIGVFYPLQTFTKGKALNINDIPICIEGENTTTSERLYEMASAITDTVIPIHSDQRKSLHLAAVFACNFTNHFLKIAGDILQKNKLKFSLLEPLIRETVSKALEIGPENSQTGPAKRHDFEALDYHMEILQDNEELSALYQLISQHIIDTYPEDEEIN